MFNSLKYVKKLEETGISRDQAEAHLQIVSDLMENSFASQQDLKDLGLGLRHEMTLLKQELRQDMVSLKQEIKLDLSLLEQKIIQSEQRVTIKLGTIVSIAVGVAVTLTKLIG